MIKPIEAYKTGYGSVLVASEQRGRAVARHTLYRLHVELHVPRQGEATPFSADSLLAQDTSWQVSEKTATSNKH